jgi:O-antigen ligase
MALAAGCGIMVGHLAQSQGHRRWRLILRDWLELLLGGKARLRLLLIMLVIVLIATRSRMGTIAFFAALVVATCVYAAFERQRRRGMLLFAASVLAVDILLVGTLVGVDRVVERIGNTPMFERVLEPADKENSDIASPQRDPRFEQSVEDRIGPALDGLAIVRDFPWLGTGGGSFYLVYMAYQPSWEGYYNHAHNDYVEIAADTGLLGLGLLLAIGAYSFWSAIGLIRDRSHPILRSAGFATMMSVTAMALHALVDFNLHIPANALTFCVLVALPWAAQRLGAREPFSRRTVVSVVSAARSAKETQ